VVGCGGRKTARLVRALFDFEVDLLTLLISVT
jgi:hypothetical protein